MCECVGRCGSRHDGSADRSFGRLARWRPRRRPRYCRRRRRRRRHGSLLVKNFRITFRGSVHRVHSDSECSCTCIFRRCTSPCACTRARACTKIFGGCARCTRACIGPANFNTSAPRTSANISLIRVLYRSIATGSGAVSPLVAL